MSDTPDSIRTIITWYVSKDVPEVGEALERYVELLERSAGVWVPVTERLPVAKSGAGFIVLVNGQAVRRRLFSKNQWYDDEKYLQHGVTHWLDVKLPGEQR